MQSYVNQPFLDKRTRLARWASYVGLGALFLGLVLAQRNILLSYLALLVGVVGATLAAHLSSTYVRPPRADQVLERALEGLDKRFALYSYYLPSNHVVASHLGLTVLLPKAQSGEISYSNGRWHHKAGMRKIMQFFGEPGLGKPDADLQQEVGWVKAFIQERLPEANIPVNGVIIFTQPAATVRAKEAPVPTVVADGLADFFRRDLKRQPTLSTASQKELRRALDEVVASGKKAR